MLHGERGAPGFSGNLIFVLNGRSVKGVLNIFVDDVVLVDEGRT